MKFLGVLLLVTIACAPLHGQSPPLPVEASPGASTAPILPPTLPGTGDPSPTATKSAPANLPDLSQLDAMFKQTTLGKEADAYRLHVAWRDLRNRTANDPAVVSAKAYATAARTDVEKRERLRAYYKTYYNRMLALADTPEIKAHLAAMKLAKLGGLDQPRVRPTPTPAPAKSKAG